MYTVHSQQNVRKVMDLLFVDFVIASVSKFHLGWG